MKTISKPELNLVNGKKDQCWYCKTPLSSKMLSFYMKGTATLDKKRVEEVVLFCPACKRNYVTQEMCKHLSQKHPKYYVDVARYEIKPRKKQSAAQNSPAQKEESQSVNKQFLLDIEEKSKSNIHAQKDMPGIVVPIYLSNTYGVSNKICPQCHSTLMQEKVNIPVILENGDFLRYYSEMALYCNSCKAGYISKKTADEILRRVQDRANSKLTIKLANVNVSCGERNSSYLYQPTLDNDTAVYSPGNDWKPSGIRGGDGFELNTESFLHRLGYTVNRSEEERRYVLERAAKEHGKRKVADHLTFLIETRRSQVGGDQKYARAIRIWQRDKNYITSVEF